MVACNMYNTLPTCIFCSGVTTILSGCQEYFNHKRVQFGLALALVLKYLLKVYRANKS